MPTITSKRWNEKLGVCEKHSLPEIPCSQCIAGKDEDLEVRFNAVETLVLALLKETSPKLPDRILPRPSIAL